MEWKKKWIYSNGKLRFECEYLKGKIRNRKEYNNYDELLFECEHSKGKIRNRKEYNNYGELLFEGEYLNDKKHGKGKEYGNLKFEGEYFQGKRGNGNGREDNFSGEYLNGKWWNGRGKTSETFEYDRSEHGTAYKKWKIKVLKFYSNGNLSVSRFSEPVSLEEDL